MTRTAFKLHPVTVQRVNAIKRAALADDTPAPAQRPRCASCGQTLPTINGLCAADYARSTEGAAYLFTVSPADLDMEGK